MKKYLSHPVFKIVSEIVTAENTPAFVIGGYVRDCLLNRPTKDIDIVVLGDGISLARKTAARIGHVPVAVYKRFGTAMLTYEDTEIEFVGARKESYSKDSRKPNVLLGTIDDDQKRRDFTINALAISLNGANYGELIDPFNGVADLKKKLLRTPLDPDSTFSDDPLRMIRAVRFATQLSFKIDETTFKALRRNAERLEILSHERIIDELNKIIQADKPSIGFKLLDEAGLLVKFFPELVNLKGVENVEGKAHKDNFYHTLKVLDNVARNSDNIWLRWAALLHDIGKPAVKKFIPPNGWTFHGHDFIGSQMVPNIFRNLRLPLDARMKYVQKMVLLHLRPIALVQEDVTDSAVRRLLFDAGEDIYDLMQLCEADVTSKNEITVRKHLKNFEVVRNKLKELEARDAVRNFQPPVSGQDIMEAFKIRPCREIGLIKTAIKDAILDGVIHNNRDEAYQFMLKKGEELGLKVQNN
jgi:poly(A) polymerase